MCSKRVTENAQSPYAPKEPEPEEQLDPEKFKKVMKIHESDETQKRHKRNLKKEEEEGDGEEHIQEQPAPPASTSFSEFMSDKEELDNVLDSESGGIRRQAAPQQGSAFTAPPPGSISTEGVELGEEPPPPAPGPAEIPAQPPAQAEGAQQQQPPPSPQAETSGEQAPTGQPPPPGAPLYEGLPEQPPSQQQPPSTSEEAQPTQETQAPVEQPPEEQKSDQQTPKKKEESDTSLLASQPKVSDLKVKKAPKKRAAPQEKIIPAEPKIEGPVSKTGETKGTELQEGLVEKGEQKPLGMPQGKEEGLEGAGAKTSPLGVKAHTPSEDETEKPLGKTAPFKGPVQEEGNFRKLSPNEVRMQRMTKAQAKAEGQAAIEGVPISAPEEGAAMGQKGGKKKEEGGFLEASQLTASITLPVSGMPLTPITPSDVTPSYSKLSPEIYELFEKMGGVMLIQQHAGITTTTMTITMPESVFNGTQIILDQYSTAPNAFNIQLVGTPEAVKAFRANITQLENAFKQANYDFEANILNPVLTTSKKSPHLIRRKSATGDKGKGGKRGKG